MRANLSENIMERSWRWDGSNFKRETMIWLGIRLQLIALEVFIWYCMGMTKWCWVIYQESRYHELYTQVLLWNWSRNASDEGETLICIAWRVIYMISHRINKAVCNDLPKNCGMNHELYTRLMLSNTTMTRIFFGVPPRIKIWYYKLWLGMKYIIEWKKFGWMSCLIWLFILFQANKQWKGWILIQIIIWCIGCMFHLFYEVSYWSSASKRQNYYCYSSILSS